MDCFPLAYSDLEQLVEIGVQQKDIEQFLLRTRALIVYNREEYLSAIGLVILKNKFDQGTFQQFYQDQVKQHGEQSEWCKELNKFQNLCVFQNSLQEQTLVKDLKKKRNNLIHDWYMDPYRVQLQIQQEQKKNFVTQVKLLEDLINGKSAPYISGDQAQFLSEQFQINFSLLQFNKSDYVVKDQNPNECLSEMALFTNVHNDKISYVMVLSSLTEKTVLNNLARNLLTIQSQLIKTQEKELAKQFRPQSQGQSKIRLLPGSKTLNGNSPCQPNSTWSFETSQIFGQVKPQNYQTQPETIEEDPNERDTMMGNHQQPSQIRYTVKPSFQVNNVVGLTFPQSGSIAVQCEKCQNQTDLATIRMLGCSHKVCLKCLKSQIDTQYVRGKRNLQDYICPIDECQRELGINILTDILDEEQMKEIQAHMANEKQDLSCPNKGCRRPIILVEQLKQIFNDKTRQEIVKCQYCNTSICLLCSEIDHGINQKNQICPTLVRCPFDKCKNVNKKPFQGTTQKCKDCQQEFCNECLVDIIPIIGHGNHYHRRECSQFAGLLQKGTKKELLIEIELDVKNCEACKRNNAGCHIPIPLEQFKQKMFNGNDQ